MKKAFTQLHWINILKHGKPVYNFAELMRLTNLSVPSLHRALHRLMNNGFIIKLSKGLYANSFNSPSLEQTVGILYPPSYISMESALFMHGILEQALFIVTCVSTNKTKTFHTALGEIAYFHIKKELFWGYEITDRIPIASPEKAALDFVYLQRQNGMEPILDEWNWENLDVEKMNSMLEFYPKTVKECIIIAIKDQI